MPDSRYFATSPTAAQSLREADHEQRDAAFERDWAPLAESFARLAMEAEHLRALAPSRPALAAEYILDLAERLDNMAHDYWHDINGAIRRAHEE